MDSAPRSQVTASRGHAISATGGPFFVDDAFVDIEDAHPHGRLAFGAHMLGFPISGEVVEPALIGSAAAIVNGVCFIIDGVLEVVPGYSLADAPDLADFQSALWLMPAVLVVGGLVAMLLKERTSPVEAEAAAEPEPATV
jgi:hypothetical protein